MYCNHRSPVMAKVKFVVFVLLLVAVLGGLVTMYKRRAAGAGREGPLQERNMKNFGTGLLYIPTPNNTHAHYSEDRNQLNFELSPSTTPSYHPLTKHDIRDIEKFVFFTGYPRSGHSIVGSLIDAHPNILLSYAFFLFKQLATKGSPLNDRTKMFETMHKKSFSYSRVSANKTVKGYTLDVPGSWSGLFQRPLKIIGDKSAKATTDAYLRYPSKFQHMYARLESIVKVPIRVIHVVRNPFDMIATQALYNQGMADTGHRIKAEYSTKNKMNNPKLLSKVVTKYFDWARAVHEMVPLCNMTVLEIHNQDLIKDTASTMFKICDFLQVDCPSDYVATCVKKTFSEVSKTRYFVEWPQELKVWIEQNAKKYPFFQRYTYDS